MCDELSFHLVVASAVGNDYGHNFIVKLSMKSQEGAFAFLRVVCAMVVSIIFGTVTARITSSLALEAQEDLLQPPSLFQTSVGLSTHIAGVTKKAAVGLVGIAVLDGVLGREVDRGPLEVRLAVAVHPLCGLVTEFEGVSDATFDGLGDDPP